MSSSGWMTRKMPGRDDKAIAADRKKALNDRRAKRGLKPLTEKKPRRTAQRRKPKQQLSDSESEEWDSNVEEEEEEEEEDLVLSEEESEDDVGAGSFLPGSQQRNRKAKPMLEQTAKLKAKHKKNGYAAGKVTSSSSESSFSDGDGVFNKAKKPTATARKKKPSLAVDLSKDSDSDSSIEEISFTSKKPKGATTSKYFSNKKEKPKKTTMFSDLEDTPVKLNAQRNNNRKRVIDDDDDDDDSIADYNPTNRNSLGDASYRPEQEEDDGGWVDDEDAVALAMKNSLADAEKPSRFKRLQKKHQKPKKKKQKNTAATEGLLEDSDAEEESKVIYKDEVSSSSEDEQEDENDQDEFMDEDEREASSVLAAANELCSSMMRIMATMSSEISGNADGAIPQGMIVDGAFAMSSMRKDINSMNSSQHSIITNETMTEVLPNVKLAEYQLIGVNWLAMLHSMTYKITNSKNAKPTNVNGILADEMGLGKTCQTIAFLAWLKHSRSSGSGMKEIDEGVVNKGDDYEMSDVDDSDAEDDKEFETDTKKPAAPPKPAPLKNTHAEVSVRTKAEEKAQESLPHLIVMPASVVSNWEREFHNFAPHMRVIKFHGTREERDDMKETLRDYLPKSNKKNLPPLDIILAPITYFQKESSEDRDFLRRLNYDYLICDEGHLLKNAKGLRYKNLDRFRSRHRLLLTGTPVQNSPQELMALLTFLMPLFKKKKTGFDDKEPDDGGEGMLQHFVNLESAKHNQEDSQQLAYAKLKQLFSPFVLRRRKKDVLSQIIPPKSYEVEFVTLTPEARKQYNAIVEEHVKAKRNKTKSATEHLFSALRKASHHPHLLRTRFTSMEEKTRLANLFKQYGAFRGPASTTPKIIQEMDSYSDFEIHLHALDLIEESRHREPELRKFLLTEDDLFASAKLARLQQILPKMIEEGHRVLIFSVWTSCLDLIGSLMEQMNLDFLRMDGQTAVAERQERIDQFNSNPSIPVFLLSTNACGLGITLTSADICIMHDISVNPFCDLQAEDRCHRIGQKKPVKIVKLIAKDTVDEDIYQMQERKVKMNAAIMESPSEWTKREKEEKTLMVKRIVERHSEPDAYGKENVANSNTNGEAMETEI